MPSKKLRQNSQISEGGPPDDQMSISARPQRDIIAIYHAWARVSPPTTSGEASRPLWTKSDVLTLPRR